MPSVFRYLKQLNHEDDLSPTPGSAKGNKQLCMDTRHYLQRKGHACSLCMEDHHGRANILFDHSYFRNRAKDSLDLTTRWLIYLVVGFLGSSQACPLVQDPGTVTIWPLTRLSHDCHANRNELVATFLFK